MQQPPLKKLATDGPMGAIPNSMQIEMRGATAGIPNAVGVSGIGASSISHQSPNEHFSGRDIDKKGRAFTILAQAWKEDLDAGHLLSSLFEYFGESVLSFIPKPELYFFL